MARPKKSGRAPNRRSSIYYSEADGQWHGRVTMGIKPDGGPDRRHRRGATKGEVADKLRELERKRDEGKVTKVGRAPRVSEWFERWLTRIVRREVDRNTYDSSYEPTVRRHIIPRMGRHRIDAVTPEHVEDLYLWLDEEKGLAPSTILKVHWRLHSGFQVAVERDLIARNPVSRVKPPSGEAVKEYAPLGREEARRVLKVCRDRRNGARRSVALAFGVRQAEALGLRWSCLKGVCGACRIVYGLVDLFAVDAERCPKCGGAVRCEVRVGWRIKQRAVPARLRRRRGVHGGQVQAAVSEEVPRPSQGDVQAGLREEGALLPGGPPAVSRGLPRPRPRVPGAHGRRVLLRPTQGCTGRPRRGMRHAARARTARARTPLPTGGGGGTSATSPAMPGTTGGTWCSADPTGVRWASGPIGVTGKRCCGLLASVM
ncbi:hypothetical protein HDA32_000613 [Spinactinospora alkalitolerans]|uniref:Core-binding (CB) domain-containing protein n=1 Tax=Spinactinospora alkalitolerans TaxID=687207 RepID=A0A852TS05_9ACTN|nr:hypothetical protein [Spinactinospora alkalitolerans]NYE45493.1 hypothetical protein [Spinactinospora alkalitolerans]